MHDLLTQGSIEADILYDATKEVQLDWSKVRVSSLPRQFSNYEFLRVLQKVTKVVSNKEFKASFVQSVHKLKHVIKSRRWLAVINDLNKDRNMFFFLLSLRVCPEIAESLQGVLTFPKRFQLSDFFSDFSYVYFDDVVLSDVDLEPCFKMVSNMPRIVVTAYAGEVAKHKLTNHGIQVICSEVVRPFIKFDPSRSNTVDFKYEAYPLFLSHRSIESLTGFPEVYRVVSDERDLPPYQTRPYSRYEYLVRDITQDFVS